MATLPCRHERQWRPHPLLMPLFDVIFLVNKSDLINWLRLGCYLESFFFFISYTIKNEREGELTHERWIYVNFATFYFPILKFKSMPINNYQTYTKNKDTCFFTKG